MWTIITAAAGALVGLILMRNLATLRYRRPDERELPKPPHAWWLIPALAVVWGWLTWRHQEQPGPSSFSGYPSPLRSAGCQPSTLKSAVSRTLSCSPQQGG